MDGRVRAGLPAKGGEDAAGTRGLQLLERRQAGPGVQGVRGAGIIEAYPWLAPAIEAPESGIRGVADGMGARLELAMRWRADRLRLIGNGVVWQSAARAFGELWVSFAGGFGG